MTKRFLCIESTFSGQLYEKGDGYDSIGTAGEKFFEDTAKGSAVTAKPAQEAGAPNPEREGIKAALDALEVEYNSRLGTENLKALLLEAQNSALNLDG